MTWNPVSDQILTSGPWSLHTFAEVSSTNDLALAFARQALDTGARVHGTAFLAAHQSAGRGQHGRVWKSPPGGLYLSALIEDLTPEARALLPLHIGAQIAGLLDANYDLEAGIRWPNDVVVGNKKIAGILCEALAAGTRCISIVGIGLNINQHPTELPDTAITLAQLDVTGIDIPTFALQLLNTLTPPTPQTVLQVRQRDTLFGQTLTIDLNEEILHCTGEGISDEGHLIIRTHDTLRPLLSGSILAINGHRIRPDRFTP